MAFASRDETYLRGASNDWIAAITAPVFGGTLELLGTGSDDDASVSRGALPVATSPDPSKRNALSWSNQSLGARWMKATANRSSTLSAWRSSNDAEYSWRGDTTLLGLESVRRDFGAQAVLSVASDHATTVAGLRFESIDTRYRTDSTARPDVAPSLELDATTPMATAFIEQSRVLAPHWSLGIGGAVVSIRWRSTVEPRATVTWTPRTSLTLTVTGSRTHQFVQSLRNAESVVSHVAPAELFVGAGDGRVPVATSSNAAFAAALRLSPAATLSVRAFVRSMDGLVAVSQMTREPFVTQVDAGMLRDATARAGGVSADASWRTSRVSLDLRYGWTTVMYESSGSRYAPEHAVRHQVTGGVSAWLTPTMQLRVGGVVALGRRATPVDGGVEWESCNLLDRGCEFSGVPRSTPALAGSLALPGYIRTDVSVRKQWQLGMNSRRAELALFGTVTNIFNRRNVLNFTDADGARTALQLRPLAPLVIGLDWRF